MKRRTSSRRQVLDLESNTKSSSSPRRTWQTKYQQICLDHSQSQNGNKTTTNEEKNKHPLQGLLSNYNSDSDDDTDKNSSVNLDEKVESFLKEISELTPLTEEEKKPLVEEVKTKKGTDTKKLTKASKTIQSTNVIIPSLTLSQPTPTAVQYPEEVYTAPTSAWQECYDESTGCCYYWNTETNAVTWEIPPELHAYKAALEQWNAQQLLLRQGVGMHQSYIHQAMVQNSHVNNKAELGSAKKRKGPPGHSSESEDEKIEMITSYGPTSGESESEAEASAKPPSHKKIKVKKEQKKRDNYVLEDSNSSSALQSLLTYGPDPGPPGDEANDEEYNSLYKNSLLSNIPDTGPPGEEEPDKMNEDDKFQIDKSPPLVEAVDETPPSREIINSREEMIIIDPESDGDKKSALQRLKSLKAKTSDESRSQSSMEEERNSEDEDSEGVDELSILDRLRSQARVLQDLGGEISDEVKGLIEPVKENITSQTEKENQSTVKGEKDFTPTSFSLVAGYGDDSDQEEESKSEEKSKEVVKPLFPIFETEPKDTSVSSKSSYSNLKVIKLSARAKALINASNTTSKARATNFVNTPDGLKPADSIKLSEPEPESTLVGLVDSSIHLKSFSRKKRLEVTTNNAKTELPSMLTQDVPLVAMKTVEPSAKANHMPSTSTSKQNLASKTDNQSKIPSSLGYTTAWSYSSEQMSGERRGFGFSAESQPKKAELKKAPIQFIKAETLMPAKVEAVVIEREKQHKIKHNKTTTSTAEEVSDLSQLILAKVKFLAEGKEAVSPVQTMAIQIETLVTAWEAGGLNLEYWSSWLMAMDAQLVSLEQAAAPKGWLCEWNRSYNRYFYREEKTGAVQWEYPIIEENEVEETKQPLAESIGGEEAMELCDTPPPPPTPPKPEPPSPPATPPPPCISSPKSVSPPPPPRISSPAVIQIEKTNEEYIDKIQPSLSQLPTNSLTIPPLPPLPPPPPTEPPPPLPPNTPPPPPPETPPPPPPPSYSNEPLPPGVDHTEDYFHSRPQLVPPPPPPPQTPPPIPPEEPLPSEINAYAMGYDVSTIPVVYDPYQMHQATEYSQGLVSSHYGPSTMYSNTQENYVIARAPENTIPANLATELNSFYNDIAALEPEPPPKPPSPKPPPVKSPSPPPPPRPETPPPPQQEVAKKRKKTKLAPGLSLKKKGVSSLVAKWQQVQEEARKGDS